MKSSYTILGLMSGTSLDGLDMALCQFTQVKNTWQYKITAAITIPYDHSLKEKLENAIYTSAYQYVQIDVEFARFIADQVNKFIKDESEKPQLIASHGHTVFHQPELGITTQIGSGAIIAARTGITTVSDFRTYDVAIGGQGAPLVPIGDELLFGAYDGCLNLGGFSNGSFRAQNRRVAFDISPCNMALNKLARECGKPYDDQGKIAQSGQLITPLLEELNNLDFYSHTEKKSLGKEWFETCFYPIIEKFNDSIPDKLRTVTEHIAIQITAAFHQQLDTSHSNHPNIFVTGGGTFNDYLLSLIREKTNAELVIPSQLLIEYKEALIFAFLGLLRMNGEINCLKTVTGALHDSCCGAIYGSNKTIIS